MKTQGSYSSNRKDYHLVTKDELIYNHLSEDVQARVSEEFNMRVEFAKEKYNNTYDDRHLHWMGKLVPLIKTHNKLNMTLDACIVHSKIKTNVNVHGVNVRSCKIQKRKRGGHRYRYNK